MTILRHRALVAPTVLLFAVLASHALLETARDALFLAKLGPERLAWAYLFIAASALIAVAVVRRSRGARDPRRALVTYLAVAAAGTAVHAALIDAGPWVALSLYVWTGLVATLAVPALWTLIESRIDIVEAKRGFAIVGSGGAVGALAGSAVAAGLGQIVATRHLVTAGALGFAASALAAVWLVPAGASGPSRGARAGAAPPASRRSRRYLRVLFAVGFAATVTLTLGDLTFKRVVAERLPVSDLATVFGTIYAGLALVSLLIQLLVTSRLLTRRGVGDALVVLPVIVVAASLGFAVTGASVAILLLKLGDGGLRHSLHRVASEILFVPLPDAVRQAAKPVVDTVAQRGGQAAAALLVFAAGALDTGAKGLAAITAAAGMLWLVATQLARRAYIEQFRDSLKSGEIHRDGRVPTVDADAAELLTELLSSPDEVEAVAALDVLDRGGGRVPTLVLYHPRHAVVRRALSCLTGDLRPEVVRVLDHLHDHEDPEIRGSALAASSRTGYLRERLRAALADPDQDVRAVALVALAGDREHMAAVWPALAELVAGPAAAQLALARAIGHAPGEPFAGLLRALLTSGDVAVEREVLAVLSRAPALVDPERILPFVADPHTRQEARRVFTAAGERGLACLIAALADPETPPAVRRHLPRTISRFRSPAACLALVEQLSRETDGTTEFKILRALGRLRSDDPALPIVPAVLRAYVRRSVTQAARYTQLAERFDAEGEAPATSGGELLRELLAEKRGYGIEHAFRALGILYPAHDLRGVHDAVVGSDPRRRGAAREIVEGLLPLELRVPLLAVLDDLPPEIRRERLGELALGPLPSYELLVAELLADASESVRCIAAHHAAARGLRSVRGELTRLRPETGSPLLIQAFDHAIARLPA